MTKKETAPMILPVLSLRGLVLFPKMMLHFDVGRKKSILALNAAMQNNQSIYLAPQLDIKDEDPGVDNLAPMGVVGTIKQILKQPGDGIRILVEGNYRAKITDVLQDHPYMMCDVVSCEEAAARDTAKTVALIRAVKEAFGEYMEMAPKMAPDIVLEVQTTDDPGYLADYITANIMMEYQDKIDILCELHPVKRLQKLLKILTREVDILKLETELSAKVKEQIDQNQREYFMREQIKAITDHDDMDLYTLGEKKCALYAVIPDNDTTFTFLVSLLYSQIFQTLYYCADQIHHGALPCHVHFILDEAPSVNLPGLPRELATMRSRNISCSTIIQNMAQIKEQFKDSWETIPGNSDTLLYLGGNESSTHKYISEALGKSTIDTKTHGETKGKSGSWSTNMQISGRELLTPDEVRRLDNRYAILLIRGAGPVMDLKYDLMKHPAVRQTSLAGGPPYIHHRQNQAPVISGHEFFAAFSTDDTNENKENAA